MAPIIAPSIKLSNGYSIPVFGVGTWQAQPGEVGQALRDAIDIGYRHIDCAMLYGNEVEIGVALRDKIKDGTVKREDLFITSKILGSLGVTSTNLIHWPVAFKDGKGNFPMVSEDKFDTEYVDITETYKGMEQCVTLGLAKSIGVSNFNSEQIARILEVATIKPVNNQVECHAHLNQKKLTKFCAERGISLTAYCPLGGQGGNNRDTKADVLNDPKIKQIAAKHGKTPAQVALKYLIQIGTIPIPKSVKRERLIENIDIFNFELSSEDIEVIDTCNCNNRTIPFGFGKHDKNYPFNIEF